MRRLTVFLILFSLIIIMPGGELLASEFGLFDDYQYMAGAFYTRPEMTEFTNFFDEVYGAIADDNQAFGELLERFDNEGFENTDIDNYSFSYSTYYPSGPIDSFGFYLNLINTTEFGYRALLNYDLFRLNFAASGSNALSVEFDGEELSDYNEAELFYEYESKMDIQMLIHSFGAEYHFPFFAEVGNKVPDILRFLNFNVGGAYYWGFGEMTFNDYKLERLVGEDSDGEAVDQSNETSKNQNYDLTLVGSPGYKIGVGFDYPVYEGMLVSAGVNYRVLEMDIETSGNGEELIGDMTEDFSGLEMKLGILYQF